jgi:hypothetical protein
LGRDRAARGHAGQGEEGKRRMFFFEKRTKKLLLRLQCSIIRDSFCAGPLTVMPPSPRMAPERRSFEQRPAHANWRVGAEGLL